MMTPCIHATGHKQPDGYVMQYDKLRKRNDGAHRIAYRNAYGEIPDGHEVDHLCKVVDCINPEHLEAVTPRVNFLRSNAPAAVNARKTHCNSGHEFTPENTKVRKNGKRDCIACYLSRRLNPTASVWSTKRG